MFAANNDRNPVMSLHSSRANLMGAMKELNLRWERAHETWDDPVSREIYENYIEPLEPKVRLAITAMEQMSQVLATAVRECS